MKCVIITGRPDSGDGQQITVAVGADWHPASEGVSLAEVTKTALRAGSKLTRADLTGADLSNTVLVGLYDGVVTGTLLAGANLVRCKFCGSKLINANLAGADLTGADLTGAKLYGADLENGAVEAGPS